jgi:predicted nucleic acid-binding protein
VATRLLDTNIASYLLKGHPLAARYRPHLAGHLPAVSFMTVGELYEGAMTAAWGPRRWASLHALLGRMVVLETSDTVCHHFAAGRAQRRAQPIAVADAWIAATALTHGIELVTHNPSGFHGIAGLRVITEAP